MLFHFIGFLHYYIMTLFVSFQSFCLKVCFVWLAVHVTVHVHIGLWGLTVGSPLG